MNILTVMLGGAMGALLGFLFFAGLWLTIQKGLVSEHPGIWFSLSLLLRLSAVVLGFIWVARQGWQSLIAALVGFLVVRGVLSGKIKHRNGVLKQGKEDSSDDHQS